MRHHCARIEERPSTRSCLTHRWHHSTCSVGADATCVEVAVRGDRIAVRDSKDPNGPDLHFTVKEWLVFLCGVKAGEFDLPGHACAEEPGAGEE